MKSKTGLSRKERKAMGLTFAGIVKRLKRLKKAGALKDAATTEEIAALVLNQAVADHPKVAANLSIDMDALLAWLEVIVKIIMLLAPLFL